MFTFVCWKWDDPGYERKFPAAYVNILRAMLERHCSLPHRLVCVTEDIKGLDPRIEVTPPPPEARALARIANPAGQRFPKCYQRLWNFSHSARALFGERFMALDIDVVITGALDPLIARTENFVGWTDPAFRWNKVAGGIYMMTAGAHPEVWEDFDPKTSPRIAKEAGCHGSDQGWISYKLYPPEGTFTRAEGVVSAKWLPANKPLPQGVRIVSTPGELKPWSLALQRRFPWLKQHWTL